MSVAIAPAAVAAPEVRRSPWRLAVYLAIGLLLVSAARQVTGAQDIDSTGALRGALVAAIPILLAGLGGLWSERAGVVNIGLEGMMILGTLGAGYLGYHYGAVAGIAGAVLFGVVGGLLHALMTVLFGIDHIVSGVAINIMALGVTGYLAETWFSALPGGGQSQSPPLPNVPTITIGPLVDLCSDMEKKHWFLVSDVFSVLGVFFAQMSLLTVIALALVPLTAGVLWRSALGLRIRSTGEAPSAAESLGVNVYRYKIAAVTVSGALAGLGGGYLAMVATSGYQNNMTNGMGYIGLAAMIFGNWRPGGLLIGSLLFGYTQAVQLRNGEESLHALLLVAVVALLGLAVVQFRRGARGTAVTAAVASAGCLVWYLATDLMPREFTGMAPYVTTLLVLAFAAQSLRMPAADGQIYRKGSAG
jgi:general nucleoside transport system permease protein